MKKLLILFLLAPALAIAQQTEELALLQKALTTLHPGIFRYETPKQIDSIFQAAQRKVQRHLPQGQYFILLAQLLTNVHCGHTYTNYWNQPKEVREKLYSRSVLPFLYRMIGRQMIVTHNLSSNKTIKPSDEVLSINGVPVKQIVDSLLTVSPSDGLHGLPRKLDNISIVPLDADTSNYNLADIFLPLFFTANYNVKTYTLNLQHFGSKKTFTLTVASDSKKERLAIYNSRFGTLPVHEKNWSLKMINKETALFSIGDFETWEWKKDYKKFLDSVFTKLQKVKNLVVDIRGNGGGDDEARDEVVSYLTDQPFGCEEPMHRRFRFLSIPDTLLPFLKTWNKSFKEAKNAADYVQGADGLYEYKMGLNALCVPVQPKPNRFKGRKFLLIDDRNASTTFTMAKLFKQGRMGTVVGEPTGGNQQGINGGQFFFLNLPYSKIEADIPLVWGAYTGTHPDTGMKPDKLVSTTRQSIAQGKDPQLEAVLAILYNSQ